MKCFSIFSTVAVIFAVEANAQEVSPDAFDAKGYVTNLNSISEIWAPSDMTNADVTAIASVGCETVRKMEADNFIAQTDKWIEATGFPSPEVIQDIDRKEFTDFELSAFREAGASDKTLDLVSQTFSAMESLPTERPNFSGNILSESGAEQRFCEAASLGSRDPNAPATEAQVVLAGAVVDTAIGAGIIAIDVYATTASGGFAAGIFGALSVGYGWDKLKLGIGS